MNIFRRQNSLELVFQDISQFDAQNPGVGSLLRVIDISKKDIASGLVGKVPRPGLSNDIHKKLDALRKDNFLVVIITIIITKTTFHRHHHHQHLIILTCQYFLHRHRHHYLATLIYHHSHYPHCQQLITITSKI